MNTCETCVFFKPGSVLQGGSPGQGVCFRYPPSVFPMNVQGGVGSISLRAGVKKEEPACGEYETNLVMSDFKSIGE